MSACRSCGAPIRWERTAAGKAIPLDPDPVPDGSLAFRDDGRIVDGKACPPGDRFKTHFATCPNAASHRRDR